MRSVNDGISRRQWMAKSLAAMATLGIGAPQLLAFDPKIKPELSDLTPGTTCTLTCAQTLGPCYYSTNNVRRDITEGRPGLPTLLGFLVVDADTCRPVANAAVDIWHTDASGTYSAPISTFCNGPDASVRNLTFCRGIQLTDAAGWAYFNTIYPGWYSGRTTHIHATIRLGTTAAVTTQFYFGDTLNNYIYANHPLYRSRPVKNTTNLSDNVIGGNATRINPFLFNAKLINDETLIGVKVVAIRSAGVNCNA